MAAKKKQKPVSLHSLSLKELQAKLRELQSQLVETRLKLAQHQLKDVHAAFKLRKEIARVKTIIREKELKGEKQP